MMLSITRPVVFTLLLCAFLLCSPGPIPAQDQQRHLTLDEALDLALKQSSAVKIARFKLEASERRVRAARSDYYPQLFNTSNYWNLIEEQRIEIPRGAFGVYPATGPIPGQNVLLGQGGTNLFFTVSVLGQPITQLYKVRQGVGLAQAEAKIAGSELAQLRNEIAVGVHQLYFGILIAGRQKEAAELKLTAARQDLEDAQQAVDAGATLQVAVLGKKAAMLESQQALLAAADQISDLSASLNNLVGLPIDTRLHLVPPSVDPSVRLSLQESVQAAVATNPEIQGAEQQVEKAQRAVKAAKADYIPDFTAFGAHLYQNQGGLPFLSKNNGVLGVAMTWRVLEFGKRSNTLRERESLMAAAQENVTHLKDQVTVEVEKAWRKMKRAEQMMDVARQALELRRESDRLAAEQLSAGLIQPASRTEAGSALARSEADFLAAGLNYKLSEAELQKVLGTVAH